MTGTVKHKPGSANAKLSELIRYNAVSPIQSESLIVDTLKKASGSVVATGQGTELYKDPGDGFESVIILAPMEAAKDAFNAAGSTNTAKSLVINVAGGDDLIVLEMVDAVQELVKMLDVPTKAKITLNSLSHETFADEQCTMTVVAFEEAQAEDDGEAPAGALEKAIVAGEVYCDANGKWWTVVPEDINPAIA